MSGSPHLYNNIKCLFNQLRKVATNKFGAMVGTGIWPINAAKIPPSRSSGVRPTTLMEIVKEARVALKTRQRDDTSRETMPKGG